MTKRRAFWAIGIAIGIAVLAWRWRRGDRPTGAKPVASEVAAAARAGDPPLTTAAARPTSDSAAAHAASAPAASPAARPGPATGAPAAPAAARSSGAALPPAPSPQAGSGSSGGLTDRTGWGDGSTARQINREFMPLADECIAQAQARDRRLRGLLAFRMVLAPTGNGRVIVASLELRPDNQIDDAELFECIRESSFALDGLTAPHDFDITMPIEPGNLGS